MIILALNAGSSSLKFKLFERVSADPLGPLAWGGVERLGPRASFRIAMEGGASASGNAGIATMAEAVEFIVGWLEKHLAGGVASIAGVGHRVVHGGERFIRPALIDPALEQAMVALGSLAPLHNGPSLDGIREARRHMPGVPMVAVFDTAFHAGLPAPAASYALPRDLARRHGIRRFGFHGLVCQHVVDRYPVLSGKPAGEARLIVLHLGSGCSATAIRGGRSMDTSMGFTPLEGLVMATRSGDLDPAIPLFLSQAEGVPAGEIERLLNEDSGLAGLSGVAGGAQRVLDAAAEGNEDARLARDLFVHRARKYVGAYLAVLGGIDALVFSGGIGERSPEIRAAICMGMEWCGLRLDQARNTATIGGEARVSPDGASAEVYVIAADEERVIARQTAALIEARGKRP